MQNMWGPYWHTGLAAVKDANKKKKKEIVRTAANRGLIHAPYFYLFFGLYSKVRFNICGVALSKSDFE